MMGFAEFPANTARQEMSRAKARHILVADEQAARDLKTQIDDGADFAAMARQHSQCPSRAQGGDLGEFRPGQMVPEFDKVVFSAEVGQVHGPVQTQFGYHLIEITSRT
jgi:peptidyl-prolyl cis-trans isomerase C